MKTIRSILSVALTMIIMSTMLLVPVKAAEDVQSLSNTETTVFGNSSFSWNHTSSSPSTDAADGTYTKFEGGGATITATKTFYVEKASEFDLEVYAASSITHNALSDIQFNIDTDSAVALTKSNSTVEALANPCLTGEPWEIKSIKYGEKLLLDEGTHTLTITIPQNSNNRTAAYFAFDCARFIPTDTVIAKVNNRETTVFGNSSFSWNHTSSSPSTDAADGTYTKFEGGGATITATKTFYVEKASEFDLEVYAASSITHNALSDIQFNIDTDSAVALTKSNSTVEVLGSPCLTGEPWEIKNIKYGTKLMLGEGLHTLTITVPQNSNNRTAAYFAFDCARLIPSNTMVSNKKTNVFGNSSFTWNHVSSGPSADAADGTYTKFEGAGATIIATKTFYVENTGVYGLELYAASSITHDALSDIQFNIDTDSAVALTKSNSTVEVLANPCLTGEPWEIKNIKYGTNLLLTEGLHTLTITVPQNSNNRTAAYFAFDCANLVPSKDIVNSEKTAIFGNSSFAWSHVSSNPSADAADETYTKFEGAGATITATRTFYVEEDGDYALEVYAASSITHSALSDLQFNIDTDLPVTFTTANSSLRSLGTPCITGEPWTTKNIKYNTILTLAEGSHTLTFTIPQNSNNRTEAYFVFDCARIVPVLRDVIPENGGVIEFEKHAEHEYVVENTNANGGAYAYYEWVGEDVEETILFTAEKAGYYSVIIDATSAKATENNMSYMNFRVNDSSYVLTYEADNHTASFKTDVSGNQYPNETFAICEIVLKDVVYLNAGENTLDIVIPKRIAGDAVFAVVDCVKFTPVGNDIEGIAASIGDDTLEVGIEATVTVTDTAGNALDNVTITSTDSSVVSVGVDKKLTAVGVGRATIKVSARKLYGMPEHTASIDVCVGHNGIFVKTLENNAGTVTATFELNGVDASNLDVYVGVYNTENNRLLTADKKGIVSGTTSLNAGSESGRTVLYVWEKTTKKPLYRETL